MSWGLNLDGFSQARHVMQDHHLKNRGHIIDNYDDFRGYLDQTNPGLNHVLGDRSKPRSCFHRHIVARIAIPLQMVFVELDMLFTQTIRGLILTIGGVLTFDLKKIGVGLTDFLSVLVQTVALPIIGVIAFVAPTLAIRVTFFVMERIGQDPKKHLASKPNDPLLREKCVDHSLGFVTAIISSPVILVRSFIRLPIEVLSGHPLEALACIFMAIKEPIVQLTRAFRITHEGVRTRLFSVFSGDYLNSPFEIAAHKIF